MSVTGWKLPPGDRRRLLARFPPTWPDVVADHVTLYGHVSPHGPLPPSVDAEVVGLVDDGEGLQALVVAIDGTTARPDGSTYHITWSIDSDRGREPLQSNDVLAAKGWTRLPVAEPLRLVPARFG